MMKNFLFLIFLTTTLFAEVERICKVSYLTQDGYSKGVPMKVIFATGQEMNDASQTWDYEQFSHYAILDFGEGKVAILEIEDLLVGVGDVFDPDDFKTQFEVFSEKKATQVNGRGRRKWKIEAKEIIRWIDPRVE